MLSQEPRCWPGDVFAVPVPSCTFEMAPVDPKTNLVIEDSKDVKIVAARPVG